MKKLVFLFSLVIAFSVTNAQEQKELTQVPKDIAFYDMDGNPKKLGDIINHDGLVLLDFWATWCKPCIMELGVLKEEYPIWKEEDNTKIVIISLDDPAIVDKVKAFADKKGWEFEMYIDSDRMAKPEMGVTQIPNLFLVDKEGNVLLHELGYSKSGVNKIHRTIKKNVN